MVSWARWVEKRGFSEYWDPSIQSPRLSSDTYLWDTKHLMCSRA